MCTLLLMFSCPKVSSDDAAFWGPVVAKNGAQNTAVELGILLGEKEALLLQRSALL